METSHVTEEMSQFLYYDEAVKINFPLFNHTQGDTTQYTTRLVGADSLQEFGLAKSLSVMPGDTVRTWVFAKYLDTDDGNWTTALTNFIGMLTGGGAPPGTIVDGGFTGTTGGEIPIQSGMLNEDKSSETGSAPMAFLNWLVFDRDYNFLEGGYDRIDENAKEDGATALDSLSSGRPFDSLYAEIPITQAGYVYIYLSNDSQDPVEVYFDDFTVEHVKSPIIQMDDYYPFGLTYNSYQRENAVPNRWKFQGQEHIDDLDLGWNSFKWRNQDPSVGRFFNIDPLAEKYVYNSPYAFSENDVVSAVELEGLEKLRVTNYSQIQSNKIRENLYAKNKVVETPVTYANSRGKKIREINKRNDEVMRVVSYGSENGFSDDYMVNRLTDSGINVPDDVKDGSKTTVVEVIDPKADYSVELNGVSENKDGGLDIVKLGDISPSEERSKVNKETEKAVVKKVVEEVIDFFIERILPVELPPIEDPNPQKEPGLD